MDTSRTDHIRSRAHEIWEADGKPHGRDVAHWLQAEAELLEMQPPPKQREKEIAPPPAQAARARVRKGAATKSR